MTTCTVGGNRASIFFRPPNAYDFHGSPIDLASKGNQKSLVDFDRIFSHPAQFLDRSNVRLAIPLDISSPTKTHSTESYINHAKLALELEYNIPEVVKSVDTVFSQYDEQGTQTRIHWNFTRVCLEQLEAILRTCHIEMNDADCSRKQTSSNMRHTSSGHYYIYDVRPGASPMISSSIFSQRSAWMRTTCLVADMLFPDAVTLYMDMAALRGADKDTRLSIKQSVLCKYPHLELPDVIATDKSLAEFLYTITQENGIVCALFLDNVDALSQHQYMYEWKNFVQPIVQSQCPGIFAVLSGQASPSTIVGSSTHVESWCMHSTT
jgi:hypothetical protein